MLSWDLNYVFIKEKTLYIAKKAEGNFLTIENSYPLSRLASIHIVNTVFLFMSFTEFAFTA